MTMDQLNAAKAAAAQEIEKLMAEVDNAALALKAKKSELKAAQKKLVALGKQEEAAAQAEAELKRQEEAKKVMAAFMESGKTLDEALEALK